MTFQFSKISDETKKRPSIIYVRILWVELNVTIVIRLKRALHSNEYKNKICYFFAFSMRRSKKRKAQNHESINHFHMNSPLFKYVNNRWFSKWKMLPNKQHIFGECDVDAYMTSSAFFWKLFFVSSTLVLFQTIKTDIPFWLHN